MTHRSLIHKIHAILLLVANLARAWVELIFTFSTHCLMRFSPPPEIVHKGTRGANNEKNNNQATNLRTVKVSVFHILDKKWSFWVTLFKVNFSYYRSKLQINLVSLQIDQRLKIPSCFSRIKKALLVAKLQVFKVRSPK